MAIWTLQSLAAVAPPEITVKHKLSDVLKQGRISDLQVPRCIPRAVL
jgi:hypothetical protein